MAVGNGCIVHLEAISQGGVTEMKGVLDIGFKSGAPVTGKGRWKTEPTAMKSWFNFSSAVSFCLDHFLNI